MPGRTPGAMEPEVHATVGPVRHSLPCVLRASFVKSMDGPEKRCLAGGDSVLPQREPQGDSRNQETVLLLQSGFPISFYSEVKSRSL